MTSKTTTTTKFKFKVEKLDGKSNFLLWKMRVTSLPVKEGTHKTLLGIEKPPKMEDDKWNDIDFRAKATIMPIRWSPLQCDERGDNYWSLVKAREPLHDEEFVEQTLHEEAVIQPSDEGRYAYSATS